MAICNVDGRASGRRGTFAKGSSGSTGNGVRRARHTRFARTLIGRDRFAGRTCQGRLGNTSGLSVKRTSAIGIAKSFKALASRTRLAAAMITIR